MLSHTQIKWVRNDKRQPGQWRKQHAMTCPLATGPVAAELKVWSYMWSCIRCG